MEAKFTRGPWRVRKDENGNTVIATMPEPSDILPGATQSWHLAIVMGTPGRRNKQANAHVMAASTLLHEALEAVEWEGDTTWDEARKMFVGTFPDCGAPKYTRHHSTCRINNALRAARGEE